MSKPLPGMKYRRLARAYIPAFVEFGGLRPDAAVLEPGCGTGRIAVALAEYMSPEGSYDGFDVVSDAVDWCLANITPDHPNFRFRHADVSNPAYNPDGELDPREFSFRTRTPRSTSSSSPRSSLTCSPSTCSTT